MTSTKTLTPSSTLLLLSVVYAFLWISLSPLTSSSSSGINAGNPSIDVTPVFNDGVSEFCGRVPVSGVSRLKLQHYASVYNVTVVPSVLIPKKWHRKIQVCFHGNSSIGLCQCEKDDWRSLQDGLWSSFMSPYERKYVDVKFSDKVTGSVTVGLDEVQQRWRYILLAVGVVSLFSAPFVSEWVPFYYTSSMAIGVLAVVLILLFQARKLLPTGRKNTFYLGIMVSVLGAGSFVMDYFSTVINSLLLNFGISQEIQNPAFVFAVLGIILFGAAFGYWLVRKYVISDDGEVDVGVAQFVKWSMFIVAVTCIFLSTNDSPLAMVAIGFFVALYHMIARMKWLYHQARLYSGRRNLWAKSKQTTPKHRHPEFLSPSKKIRQRSPYSGPLKSFGWSKTPVKSEPNSGATGNRHDFYSTFHKTPNRKKFSEEEWEEFTDDSTRQAFAQLASSPEFTDWLIRSADRIKVAPEDSSDDLDESGSDSTDEYVQESGKRRGFFSW
ncbi:Transmembrane protein 194 [Artemisia annua]|uniref:Transmembrane protein 194 n=1 Tax=Artemisia annua TaxID=35608 RepID=A0A2U1KJG6_ARTAN|nr:Transmembrane protein 194 [Artemisia annua]